MSRVQLALNVSDLEAAVDFYRKLLGADPSKRRPGYANFAISEPPLKLVLIESREVRGDGVLGALNHLGVEMPSPDEVQRAAKRLSGEGLETVLEEEITCCYALQDKVWVSDPDGTPWEIYVVLADAGEATDISGPGGCCGASVNKASAHGKAANGDGGPQSCCAPARASA